MKKSLKDNYVDKLTALTKGLTGIIPIGGSLISEIVGSLIPNQRIDRLAKYIQVLEDKLSSIPIDRMNELLNNTELIDLLEDGFFQASRASSDERREYISQIILNGIDGSQIEYSQSRSLLRLLGELTDVELIWLRYYANYYAEDFRKFSNLHKEVLHNRYPSSDGNEEQHRKYILQDYCSKHLESMGLLGVVNNNIDPKLQMLYRAHMAEITPNGYFITRLGLTLLKQLGLVQSITELRLNKLTDS